jgi:hypothetical protein
VGRTIGRLGAAGAGGAVRSTWAWGFATGVVLGTVDVTKSPEFAATPEEEGRGGMGVVGGGGGVGPPDGGLGRVSWADAGREERATPATKNGSRKNLRICRNADID